ncbi:MAG: hypothetical protein WD159_00195 [Patescibacteria group bacterium]
MKKSTRMIWVAAVGAIGVIMLLLYLLKGGFFGESRVPSAPSSRESCTLFYLDETAKADGRAFSLWCPTAGWVDLTDHPLP